MGREAAEASERRGASKTDRQEWRRGLLKKLVTRVLLWCIAVESVFEVCFAKVLPASCRKGLQS